jgi:cysteine desulfurase/selenocysteine lyase
MSLDVNKLREDFAPLHQAIKKKPLIYFDNACMTLKPKPVTDAILDYYNNFPGCHGRTDHWFGSVTSKKYEEARKKIAKFFNTAYPEEIIFVRNATEGLNLLANTIEFNPGDVVVTSDIEHNSNLLPWQIVEKNKKNKRQIIPTNPDTTFNLDKYRERMRPEVKLVSMLYTSNLSGVTFPIEDIIQIAHENKAWVCVDAAQAALSQAIDVQKLDIDFMVASVHKMWGPTGIGLVYGKKALLDGLPQFLAGGGTVEDITYGSAKISPLPDKFEAGLQDYAGAIGAGAAVDYIREVGQKNIRAHTQELNVYATSQLSEIRGVEFIGPQDARLRSGIVNLWIEGIPVADASKILNESENIMARYGKHCLHSWYNSHKKPDSLRFSFGAYNTFEEIDVMVCSLQRILKFFRQ